MQEMFRYAMNLVPRGMDFLLSLVAGLVVFLVGNFVIKTFLKVLRKSMEKREMDAGVVSFLVSASKITLYILLIFVVAQIFGFATSSIVAILGSAGLAIGLALQGSLANFAGGVLILIMKPFRVGDYIVVEGVEGAVQKIDVVYTTLVTVDNRSVIMPNGKLADSNIINVTKEDKRRIDIQVGIAYEASIKEAKSVLQQILDEQTSRLPDMPANVVVSDLAESAVMMTVNLWVLPDDYWPTKWQMLEQIKERFDQKEIVIPYNQLEVHINSKQNKGGEG